MQFLQRIQFGEHTPTISTDDPFEFAIAMRRFKTINDRVKGQGTLRMRIAEAGKGKRKKEVDYPEFVRAVPKLPFDKAEDRNYSTIKIRLSKESNDPPELESFPYFIPRTQCWYWIDYEDNDIQYFYDDLTDPKKPEWKRGTYDSDTWTWTEITE